jgi:hypothetical protein
MEPTYRQIKNVNSKINQRKRKAYGENARSGNPAATVATVVLKAFVAR